MVREDTLSGLGAAAFVCLAALSALPFLLAAGTFFVSDDIQMVLFGRTVAVGEIAWLPTSRWTWHRPLSAFTWIANYAVADMHAWGWHLPNIGIHIASAVLVYCLGRRLTGSLQVALSASLLFACSPATPGTVTWISARMDLLVAFFCLAALNASYSTSLTTRPRLQTLVVAACTLLALSSKESAYGLLPVSACLLTVPRVLPGFERWRLSLWPAATMVGVLTFFLVWRAFLYGSTLGGYGTPLSLRRLFTAPLLLVPSLLAPVRLWAYTDPHSWLTLSVAVGGFLVLLWRAPMWTMAGAAAVLPAAHLMSASVPIWEFDRFYYLPSVLVAGAAASLFVELVAVQRIKRLALSVVCLLALSTAAYHSRRLQDIRAAGRITHTVDSTLRQTATSATLPSGALISCARLPDSVGEAYAYRNGCEEHVRLVWPAGNVVGSREVPPHASGPVYELTREGDALTRAN